jgi:rod shape-determining protein MreD
MMIGCGILAVMLQVSLLPALRPLGVVPNVALVTVALVALYMATSEALILAAGCGLALDLAGGANFGMWTGILMLVVLVVGLMGRAGIELDSWWVGLMLVGIGTLLMTIVIWMSLVTGGANWPVPLDWVRRLVTELVLNLLLVAVLRAGLRRMFFEPAGGLKLGG